MKYNLILVPIVWGWHILRGLYAFVIVPVKTAVLSKIWRLSCGKGVLFIGRTIIRAYDRGAISIGDRSKFVSGTQNNLVGLTNPTVICAIKGARIMIGNDVGASSVVIHASKEIRIGNFVNIGGNTRIFDHDFHPLEWENRRPPQKGEAIRSCPVVIEDDVFIGTNAIILKGTRIGARSIVAAGSVVFGLDIPPDSMVKGNPARVIDRK